LLQILTQALVDHAIMIVMIKEDACVRGFKLGL